MFFLLFLDFDGQCVCYSVQTVNPSQMLSEQELNSQNLFTLLRLGYLQILET